MTHFIILEIRKCRLLNADSLKCTSIQEKFVSLSHSFYPFYMSVNLSKNVY